MVVLLKGLLDFDLGILCEKKDNSRGKSHQG